MEHQNEQSLIARIKAVGPGMAVDVINKATRSEIVGLACNINESVHYRLMVLQYIVQTHKYDWLPINTICQHVRNETDVDLIIWFALLAFKNKSDCWRNVTSTHWRVTTYIEFLTDLYDKQIHNSSNQ